MAKSVEPRIRKTRVVCGAEQRGKLIGTRSANALRASGHADRQAGHMTAPDHFVQASKSPLPRRGRPLMRHYRAAMACREGFAAYDSCCGIRGISGNGSYQMSIESNERQQPTGEERP
jgi:hypothetical protein